MNAFLRLWHRQQQSRLLRQIVRDRWRRPEDRVLGILEVTKLATIQSHAARLGGYHQDAQRLHEIAWELASMVSDVARIDMPELEPQLDDLDVVIKTKQQKLEREVVDALRRRSTRGETR